jgi:hypothetical protein
MGLINEQNQMTKISRYCPFKDMKRLGLLLFTLYNVHDNFHALFSYV